MTKKCPPDGSSVILITQFPFVVRVKNKNNDDNNNILNTMFLFNW